MNLSRPQQVSGLALGASIVLYIFNFGLLGLINIPRWWIAAIEGGEMALGLLIQPARVEILFSQFSSPEIQTSLIGLLSLLGTIVGVGAYLSERPQGWFKPAALLIVLLPPVGLAGIYYDARNAADSE